VHGNGYSHARYGAGGMLPDFVPHRCGFGPDTTPIFDCSGADIPPAAAAQLGQSGDQGPGVDGPVRSL
jgi:hypothetical protein